MIKVVVTDVDDTLLNSEEKLSEKTRNTVKKCIEKNIKVILASGRPDFGMYQFVDELNLNSYENYLLSYNGAKLTNLSTGESVYEKMLSTERLHFLVDKALEKGCDILTYQNNNVITNSDNPYASWEANALKTKLVIEKDIKKYITEKAPKVIILAEPEVAKKVKEELTIEIGNTYEVAMSKPFFVEVNDKGISKGVALDVLCKKINLTSENLLAIGDGLNDMSMLEYADLGVAMGNANEKLKEVANYITKSNDEEGFSHAIEKFVL